MSIRFALVRPIALLAAGAFLLSACEDEPTASQPSYTIRVQSGDDQFAGFGQQLEEPLQVVVENATTGEPTQGVIVEWSVVEGSGAVLGADVSSTDANGVASTTLELGPADASYQVRATVTRRVGSAALFDASAVAPAHIDAIEPAAAAAGDTVVIHGTGFATTPDDNSVLIAGFRAEVIEATTTRLRVVVPACTPTRSAAVYVNRGIVESNTGSLDVAGSGEEGVAMDVGQVLYLDDAASLECLRLAPIVNARYLVLLQNATSSAGVELDWRLTGAIDGLLTAPARARRGHDALDLTALPASRAATPQASLDEELRAIEASAARYAAPLAEAPAAAASRARDEEVGDQRDFWVFRRAGEYARVTAVVRHVSDHAILYEDLDAPDGGFEPADFEAFGAIFDDPIYETMTSVYGGTSDVDDNDRVIVLFTPVVNRLTPAGSGNAFVAGFFFGIDLLEDQSRGNDAEVFYTLVPDPEGEFGNVRTFEQILQGVPPVMAHEFQHMIHFNQRILQRDGAAEQTWLSEGLAHTAEELVGVVFDETGDEDAAQNFRVQNFLRSDLYLTNPAAVSPIGPAVPLAVRGASWLLLEYLRGHFGGSAFLTALTQTTQTGVANLTAATGLDWGTILHRWGVAVWADDNDDVTGLDPIYSYPDLDLRRIYESVGFPLQPPPLPWSDFTRTGALPSASSQYWILDAGIAPTQIGLAVAGRHAPHEASDRPQLTVVRIQ